MWHTERFNPAPERARDYHSVSSEKTSFYEKGNKEPGLGRGCADEGGGMIYATTIERRNEEEEDR